MMTVSIDQAAIDIAVTVPPVARLVKRINLLNYADAYWDAADAAAGQIPNRVTGGPPLVFNEGAYGPPIAYPFNGDPYLGSGGWDDMWATAPLATPPDGFVLRVDHDQDFESRVENPEWYAVAHQGSADDLSWALRRHRDTGDLALVLSYDGTTPIEAEATAAPSFGIGRGHLAVKVDTTAGTVEFYEQPADANIGRPLTHRSWAQIGDTVTITTGAIHQSDLDLSISGFENIIDGGTFTGTALGAYYRVHLATLTGTTLVDLDPKLIALPLGPWTVVDGYPDVGGTTTAREAPFPGGAGETWTVHNFETFSYPLTVIDRPIVQIGNQSYLAAEHASLFDARYLTVAICARSYFDGPIPARPFLTHTDAGTDTLGAGDTGWELGYRGNASPAMAVGDGADLAVGTAPARNTGDLQVLVGRIDTQAAAFTDAVMATAATAAAVGDIDVTTELLVGAGTGAVGRDASLDISRVAIFARSLTDLEVAALTADLLAQP